MPVPSTKLQSGATLVVALLILVLIMMIGIAAISTSDTQFKLAGNIQFEDSALNNAEAAVGEAENLFASGALKYSDPGFATRTPATPHLYPRFKSDVPSTKVDIFRLAWIDPSEDATKADSLMVGNNPSRRYIVQQLSDDTNQLMGSGAGEGGRATSGCSTKVRVFEITGRGLSARGTIKYVRSVYSVLVC